MRVAIVAPGEMGAAIGARLTAGGCEVFTSVAGRSQASAERATAAGLRPVAEDAELVEAVELFLSITPPGQAASVAARFAPFLAAGRVVYADCNAVAPATVAKIAAMVRAAGCGFVDGGIVGGPPRAGEAGPRVYVCGEGLEAMLPLRGYGLDVRALEGEVGQASALKMAYASLTKGLTAIGASMALGASQAGVADALMQELSHSQPQLLAWLVQQLPRVYPKAHRWVAEMEEIARFMPDAGSAQMFDGAAALYAELAADFAAAGAAGDRPARIDAMLKP